MEVGTAVVGNGSVDIDVVVDCGGVVDYAVVQDVGLGKYIG